MSRDSRNDNLREATMSYRFRQFASHMKQTHGISDLRKIEETHVLQYAKSLQKLVKNGTLTSATAQNYLSAVNRMLKKIPE